MIGKLKGKLFGSKEESFKRYDMDMTNQEALKILNNQRRVMVLDMLSEAKHGYSLRGLSEPIAAAEVDGEPSRKKHKAVYVSLYQTHIPRMGQMGAIDYDKGQDSATPNANTKGLVEMMDAIQHINGGGSE